MSSPVHTASPDTTAAQAAADCFERDINSLVVVENGDVVGIVTGMDLLEALGQADAPASEPLEKRWSAPVVSTEPDTSVVEAVELMANHDIARLIVMEDDELVGIVSTDDVVRYVPQVFHRHMSGFQDRGGRAEYVARYPTGTAYEEESWRFESRIHSHEQPSVGDTVEFSKQIDEADVRAFAAASGDTNLLHLDAEYASHTRFGRPIVHGTLAGGLISAALARLPGLTIYLSQDLSFLAPVDIGDRVRAVCEIIGTFGRNKFELATDVFDGNGEQIIEGEATVIIDNLPDIEMAEKEPAYT